MGRNRAGRLADSLPVMAAVVLGLAVVSCSGTSSTLVPKPTPTRTGAPTSDTSSAPAASSATSAAAGSSIVSSVALTCRNFIDHDPPPRDWEIVLGVVALPTSNKTPALGTSGGAHDPDPAVRLFAKTGLVIRTGTTFELVVPDEAKDMVSIGWDGNGVTNPSRRVTISCPASTSPSGWQWLAYPGGYWVPRPACVPLIVLAGGKEQRVHIGLGTPCPGQLPPQGPSDR